VSQRSRTSREEFHRPALDVLARDVREVRSELLDGLASRDDLVRWMLDLSRATLGQVDIDLLCQLGREMTVVTDDGEVASVAAMLAPAARTRSMDDTAARRMREALAARMIEPATHRAVRVLTVSATEYVDDDGDGAASHDPERQRATAMRPAVDEEYHRQRDVLAELLDGELDDSSDILDWLDRLDVATDGLLAIIDRMAVETSFQQLLTGSRPADARGREVIAARWIVPVCCLALRRVAVGANEVPDAAPLDKEVPFA
jgi:hypothetical protein